MSEEYPRDLDNAKPCPNDMCRSTELGYRYGSRPHDYGVVCGRCALAGPGSASMEGAVTHWNRLPRHKPGRPRYIADEQATVHLQGIKWVAKVNRVAAGDAREHFWLEVTYKGTRLTVKYQEEGDRNDMYNRVSLALTGGMP